MGLIWQRAALILAVLSILMGCSESPKQKQPYHDRSEPLNHGMVYNSEFASKFGLPEKDSIALDDGLLAVRVYWARFINYDDTLRIQIQLYVDSDIPVHLNETEGIFHTRESLVPSGFRYFPHEPIGQSEEQTEKTFLDFYYRVVVRSEEAGTETQVITRYEQNLVPGVQVIEFGTSFRAPFYVYLYTGDTQPTPKTDATLFHRVHEDPDDYDADEFIRFRFPSQLEHILGSPYKSSAVTNDK